MTRDRKLTEGRLYEALSRLMEGQPKRVKLKGKLTLNKINNEAGLGNSYVHKFKDFVAYAKPIIEEYNNNFQQLQNFGFSKEVISTSKIDRLKADKVREMRLKLEYKKQRDDAVKAKVELETINNTLMFRLYELQRELEKTKGTVVKI